MKGLIVLACLFTVACACPSSPKCGVNAIYLPKIGNCGCIPGYYGNPSIACYKGK